MAGRSGSRLLRVPLARSAAGKLTRPEEAVASDAYSCADCSRPVRLRKGEFRTPHFYHVPGEEGDSLCAFSGERGDHLAAKLLVIRAVEEWRRGETESPRLSRRCVACGKRQLQPLPPKVAAAKAEVCVPGGCIVDVGLIDETGAVVAAVEVHATHAVDDAKRRRLGNLPWCEVRAEDLLRQPYVWRVKHEGGMKSLPCCGHLPSEIRTPSFMERLIERIRKLIRRG